MPTQPAPKITAWSFSRWALYEKCPRKFKFTHIDKLPEMKGRALIRGTQIHDEAEKFVTGAIKKFPQSLKYFEEEFRNLVRGYEKGLVRPEEMHCFGDEFQPHSDPFHPGVWLRVKTDATLQYRDEGLAVVVDYKTGRVQPEPYWEQLDLYALATMLMYTWAESVQVELWFLDHGVILPDDGDLTYTRDDIPRLQKEWRSRVRRMFADRRFAPTPGETCRWCAWARSKGGPCNEG
jgi:hypothetical protein